MRRPGIWCVAGLVTLLASPGAALCQVGVVSGVVRVPNAPSRGAVVYLVPLSSEPLAPVTEPMLLDQRNLHFIPHTLVVVPGQEIRFRNSDPLLHNVFSPDMEGEEFDLGTYPAGESRSHTFQRSGAHVILCHIHPEMAAYVFVTGTRYHAVVDAGGRFLIDSIPPGAYTLRAWHPRAVAYEQLTRISARNTLHLEIQLQRRRRVRP
jgi:plastocyanin